MESYGGKVDYCICFKKSFEDIELICAEKNLTTIESVLKETSCGTKCGLCVPYIKKILDDISKKKGIDIL